MAPLGARRSPARTLLIALAVGMFLAAGLAAAVADPGVPAGFSARITSVGSIGSENLASAQASILHGTAPIAAPAHDAVSSPSTPYRWTNASYLFPVSGIPSARLLPLMTWDASDGYVLLFGGVSSGYETDTWTYLNGTWTNITSSVGTHPPSLIAGTMAFDPSTNSVVLFSGANPSVGIVNYTWTYHDKVWTNITSSAGAAPPADEFASLATDTAADELVLVETTVSGLQTWTFKDGTWTNVTAASAQPGYAYYPLVADDPADSGVLLTGVASNSPTITAPFYPATWLYKSGVWENLSAANAGVVILYSQLTPVLQYLPAAGAVVAFQSYWVTTAGEITEFPTSWLFANGVWTNITAAVGIGPGLDFYSGATALPDDSAVMLFSGETTAGLVNQTWFFSAPPVVSARAAPATVDAGGSVTLSASVSYGLSPDSVSWSYGDGGTGTGPSGSHTYAAAGIYAATASATDFVGQAGQGTAPVLVNAAPSAAITVAPSSPSAGSAVGLVATVTGGTAPFTYAWTLGDGSTAATASVTHTYGSSGTYSVGLTVTDAAGVSAKATATVTVSAASSSVDLTSGTGLYLLIGIIALAVVAVILGVMLARKGRGSHPPPPMAYSPPPAPGGGPPPGAT
ncbi:MAG TPA: PKD domain-containing protein [Thermoplasmata archaeon]|nr:PKD domain-containing protein [Thermoplasmata archaeon]